MKEFIYKISFPNNRVYIGKAKDYKERWEQHKMSAHRGDNNKLYKAMRDYGILNLKFEVIGEFDSDIIFDKEREYIELYDSVREGYNTYESNRDMNIYRGKTQLIELYTNKYFSCKKDALNYFNIKQIHPASKFTSTKEGKLCFIPLQDYVEMSTEELDNLYQVLLIDRFQNNKRYERLDIQSIINID